MNPTDFDQTQHAWAWKHKLDLLVAVCALVTSMASIWLSVSQADDMQRLVQAQSWRFLGYSSGNADTNPATGKPEPVIGMEIENLGVGPAKIETMQLWYRGKAIRSSSKLLHACCIDAKRNAPEPEWRSTPLITSNVVGRVLRAGQKIAFFSWARPAGEAPVWDSLDKARFEIELKTCYCSVFDECWVGNMQDTKATPVAHCPATENRYTQ